MYITTIKFNKMPNDFRKISLEWNLTNLSDKEPSKQLTKQVNLTAIIHREGYTCMLILYS